MTEEIIICVDYVCPYCLLAEAVVRDVVPDKSVTIDWRAFDLRPDPVPTLRPEDPYLPTVLERWVYALVESLGVPIRLLTWFPQPRTAMAFELLAIAKDERLGDAYSMRVLRAFFRENHDIGEIMGLKLVASIATKATVEVQ